jgi:glycerate kinase
MRIVVAPQEFKGTLTAQEAAEAMVSGVKTTIPDATVEDIPLSDGGPGLVDVILASATGRRTLARVQDPLGRPIDANWAILEDGTAVIESAAAAGLVLLREEEFDPARTSTYGVGHLILSALDAGCQRIIVGVGGSATNDGGVGMAAAIGARFLDHEGRELPPGGAALVRLHLIDASSVDSRLRDVEVVAAMDVTNPLCGPEGASLVYAPQKGASPELARKLDAALCHYGEIVARDVGVRVNDHPGAGAAGGLAAGLIAFAGAEVRLGFEVVAEAIRLRERLSGADLVITGEGRLDGQTQYGKAVMGVARMASESGIPVLVVPGALGDGWDAVLPYVDGVEPLAGGSVTAQQALENPLDLLSITVQRALTAWRTMRAAPADAH